MMTTTSTPESIKIKDTHILLNEPGTLRVIKRQHENEASRVVAFEPERITIALKKAFLAVEGNTMSQSEHIQNTVTELSHIIIERLKLNWVDGGIIHIEAIQDMVELTLMRAGEQQVARAYVLYREQRRIEREQRTPQQDTAQTQTINITLDDGSQTSLDTQWLKNIVTQACSGLKDVDALAILTATEQNLFEGVNLKDLYKALVMTARTLIEQEPNYSYVTARLLLHDIYREGFSALNVEFNTTTPEKNYGQAFKAYIKMGIANELLDPKLNDFDLDRLANELLTERDSQFTYLSLQTLYDRYFIHKNHIRLELPQCFFMRVAMGLAHCEGPQRNDRAIEFYQQLSSFDYMSSTPTLFNSATLRPQLSSCYLTTVPDDLDGIYGAIKDNALLSKFAGGLGNDWTSVRALGAHIKGTNGKSLGIVPFLNVADATAVAVNQGGKRKGAVCAYLETWHMDIEEFLELRKNTGDERRRTHDMNTANWVPDLFMERVFNNQDWTLFSPDEADTLHESYGEEFKAHYLKYEQLAKAGKIRSKTISAVTLWRKMLGMLFETGHPWITFKDACNIRSPQQHAGVIHSSNLCTEITLNTSQDEIAVCNLGSINLAQHITNGKIDRDKLAKTIKTAIRMLDNVIDINYYSVPQAENSNLKHRPIGLGIMGFQDALYKQNIAYASQEAVEFADECMEIVSYHAIEQSIELAKERGTYSSYKGSHWSQGILPIDSINLLKESRGKFLEQNTDCRLDWAEIRKKLKKYGMRNSNVMAIAPTATISNICGVSQSIEPTYQNLFVKSNLSGEFTITNAYLINDLKKLELWDSAMIHDLKYHNGNLDPIERIPSAFKTLYATAFEIEPKWLVECASRRQKWIDQGQSLNIYMAEPSGKKLDILYRMAWLTGLKTTYYLRSVGATSAERATISDGKLNAVNAAPNACSIDDPDCEACQ